MERGPEDRHFESTTVEVDRARKLCELDHARVAILNCNIRFSGALEEGQQLGQETPEPRKIIVQYLGQPLADRSFIQRPTRLVCKVGGNVGGEQFDKSRDFIWRVGLCAAVDAEPFAR